MPQQILADMKPSPQPSKTSRRNRRKGPKKNVQSPQVKGLGQTRNFPLMPVAPYFNYNPFPVPQFTCMSADGYPSWFPFDEPIFPDGVPFMPPYTVNIIVVQQQPQHPLFFDSQSASQCSGMSSGGPTGPCLPVFPEDLLEHKSKEPSASTNERVYYGASMDSSSRDVQDKHAFENQLRDIWEKPNNYQSAPTKSRSAPTTPVRAMPMGSLRRTATPTMPHRAALASYVYGSDGSSSEDDSDYESYGRKMSANSPSFRSKQQFVRSPPLWTETHQDEFLHFPTCIDDDNNSKRTSSAS